MLLLISATAMATVPTSAPPRVQFSEAGPTVSVAVAPRETDDDMVVRVDLICLGADRSTARVDEVDLPAEAATSGEVVVTSTCGELTYFRLDVLVSTPEGEPLERTRSRTFVQVEQSAQLVVVLADELATIRPDLAADMGDDLFGGLARMEVAEAGAIGDMPVVEAEPHGSESEGMP